MTKRIENWHLINAALSRGNRGLPGGSSLAQFLKEHRGARNEKDLPNFTINQILNWADKYRESNGKYPKYKDGKINGTEETWNAVDNSLRKGTRGLLKGSSLAKVLEKYRKVKNHLNLPKLTIDKILVWADRHNEKYGKYPNESSGKIEGTNERWDRINGSLIQGLRGLPETSLLKLLEERRGVRNRLNLQNLTVEEILGWADEHNEKNGEFPNRNSGEIEGTNETWKDIDNSLKNGKRGLTGKSSLVKLLVKHREVKNRFYQKKINLEQVLIWIDDYHEKNGNYPTANSGTIDGTEETWEKVSRALYLGLRGLPKGSSLIKTLQEHRGVRNSYDLPNLSVKQILVWSDEYRMNHGKNPNADSGEIEGTNEKWIGIDHALKSGSRGLIEKTSLAKLLAKHRNVKNRSNISKLTKNQILTWIDRHKEKKGTYPKAKDGKIDEIDEKWRNIDQALRQGHRGLLKGSSIYKLRIEHGRI